MKKIVWDVCSIDIANQEALGNALGAGFEPFSVSDVDALNEAKEKVSVKVMWLKRSREILLSAPDELMADPVKEAKERVAKIEADAKKASENGLAALKEGVTPPVLPFPKKLN
jgi:hypothetical protein